MNRLKSQIIGSNPISGQNISSFNFVEENTQGSVKMQKEIEYASEFYTTNKRLTSKFITGKIHNQKDTNLCTSISVMSGLRAAQAYYLGNNGHDRNTIRTEQDDVKGKFSFDKCLVLFTGCVSPRSLDGIILNSTGSTELRKKQVKIFGTAIDLASIQSRISANHNSLFF